MRKDVPKITNGELKILEILWKESPLSAGSIASILNKSITWNRNTTYTFIKRLVDKKVVSRTEPGFMCKPLFTREEVRFSEAKSFIDRIYEGSLRVLMANFVNSKGLTKDDAKEIRKLLDKIDKPAKK